MLQYLIILLDDTSTSYCHYENVKSKKNLISLENLKAGIFYGMKENLMIQFVYPDYELPKEYLEAIETIDHSIIASSNSPVDADVIVFNHWCDMIGYQTDASKAYVLRIVKEDLVSQVGVIKTYIGKVKRLNIVITDVDTFKESDFDTYKEVLSTLSKEIENLYINGFSPQLNLLTDRMMIQEMNNCNAGSENITLAPDGKFYVCPAFYQADSKITISDTYIVGSLVEGLDIKNAQLYKIDRAPLCRICDAYQCKRCVWLNRKTTFEVNTPSHEQCVVAHLERNASRELLQKIRTHGTFLPETEIKEIEYLDPFDVREQW